MIYFGMTLENELEQAGQKPDKEARKIEIARKRVFDRVMGTEGDKGRFADPMSLFK